jgi:protein-tyrosine phosphatase
LVIPIRDEEEENISEYLEEVTGFMNRLINEGKNLLVHCTLGVSRSATIVIAYLIKKHHMTLRMAFHFLRNRRHVV